MANIIDHNQTGADLGLLCLPRSDCQKTWAHYSKIWDTSSKQGERGGSEVECRTPEREVRGSRPTAAVLCPWARHFTPRKYWLITQEAMAPSRYDWKIVDWDVKPQHNQPTSSKHQFMPYLCKHRKHREIWDSWVSVGQHLADETIWQSYILYVVVNWFCLLSWGLFNGQMSLLAYSMWCKDWSRKIYMGQWPPFHGSVILS